MSLLLLRSERDILSIPLKAPDRSCSHLGLECLLFSMTLPLGIGRNIDKYLAKAAEYDIDTSDLYHTEDQNVDFQDAWCDFPPSRPFAPSPLAHSPRRASPRHTSPHLAHHLIFIVPHPTSHHPT